jgi:hypothetical protein
MSWLNFNVTIDNAGRVTRNSGDPISTILEGQALLIGGGIYQILTTSSSDFTIKDWSGTITSDAVILPTVGDVVSAARKLTEVSIFANNLYGQLADLAKGTGTKTLTSADGVNHQIKTFPQIALDTADSFGEFGLGLDNVGSSSFAEYPTTSINDISARTGSFRTTSANTGTFPDYPSVSKFAVIENYRYDSKIMFQRFTDVNENTFFREVRNDGVSEWNTIFTSKNSVNPRDFGLGVTNDQAVTIGNFNTIAKSGLYGSNGGEEGSPISSGIVSTLVLKEGSQNQTDFLSIRGTSGSDIRAWIRGGKTDTRIFTNWAELYHTENSVNPLDLGLGVRLSDAPVLSDFKANNKSGLYKCVLSNTVNGPETQAYFASVVVTAASGGTNYIVTRMSTNDPAVFFGSHTTSSDTIVWSNLFHSGNTNFNVFGGIASNVLIGNGHCGSSGTAFIYLDLNSFNQASTISFAANSTFKLIDETGSVIRSGIPISQINLDAGSSGKKARIRVFGNTDLTIGKPCELRQDNAQAKITVNF